MPEASRTQPPSVIVGQLAHVLIGQLLADGHRHADAQVIARTVRELPLEDIPTVHPYAVAQQLAVTAAIYLRLFAPAVEWKLKGREVATEGCRFDLVFSQGRKRMVDQVKTGRVDSRLANQQLDAQLARELKAGQKAWPQGFIGVRAVILGAPRHSRMVAPDGSVTYLAWQQ